MLPISQIIIAFTLLASVKMNAVFITTDNLQNAYCITQQNTLVKMDSMGTTLFTYSQNRLGVLKFVDATNPMKVILSYPDFGTLVFVDNTLSELSTISVRQIGIADYSAVCFSPHDNNIWVFDSQDMKLKKIDRNQDIIIESSDIFSSIGMALHPVFMQEDDDFVYLSDPDVGIVVFDIYGVYYQTLPFLNLTSFQINNDHLFYQFDNALHSYHLKSLEEKEIVLPDTNGVKGVRIDKDRLWVMKKGEVEVYGY